MKRVAIVLGAVSVMILALVLVQRHLISRPDEASEGAAAYRVGEKLTPEQERELHRIADLGYMSGRAEVPETTGVLRHDASASSGGHTLFTYARGPEATLVDIDGEVLHSWSVPGSEYWARAHVFENGDLLALTTDPYSLIKLDSNSNVLWIYDEPVHHDFEVMADGSIWVIAREATTRAHIHDGAWLLDDVIYHLDGEGQELGERVSVLESFEASASYRDWVDEARLPTGTDIFHTNSLEIQEGGRRVLVSIRSLGVVAMLGLDGEQVDWALEGPWRMQHEAQLVGGSILLFDNAGLGDQSRVIELDRETHSIVWSYTEPGFLSKGAGAQQRLPNGNVLISESEAGRIVEVTRSGEVVWEFVNPRTVGDALDRVLGIMRAVRVPADLPLEWAAGAGEGARQMRPRGER